MSHSVRLSKGEKLWFQPRSRCVILADCFEAVIGAIYLDQGYDAAKDFIAKHILVKLDKNPRRRKLARSKILSPGTCPTS